MDGFVRYIPRWKSRESFATSHGSSSTEEDASPFPEKEVKYSVTEDGRVWEKVSFEDMPISTRSSTASETAHLKCENCGAGLPFASSRFDSSNAPLSSSEEPPLTTEICICGDLACKSRCSEAFPRPQNLRFGPTPLVTASRT